MRDIKYLCVHCTASNQEWKASDLMNYFTKVKHWRKAGYHYVIEKNGNIVQLVNENESSNGVRGYNRITINVAYIGGVTGKSLMAVDNRTDEQKKSLRTLLTRLKSKYPNAIIQGHRDFPNVRKECPCFNAKDEYKDIIIQKSLF